MNVKVVWDTPDHKVLRLVFQPHWTRDGLNTALDIVWQALERSTQSVHIIVDQTSGSITASTFLAQAKQLSLLAEHPHTGSLIVVGADDETLALCEVASYRNSLCDHMHFADTLDDAYSAVAQLDFVAGLNNLLDNAALP